MKTSSALRLSKVDSTHDYIEYIHTSIHDKPWIALAWMSNGRIVYQSFRDKAFDRGKLEESPNRRGISEWRAKRECKKKAHLDSLGGTLEALRRRAVEHALLVLLVLVLLLLLGVRAARLHHHRLRRARTRRRRRACLLPAVRAAVLLTCPTHYTLQITQ